ncbi:MAG: methyltransferase domain-containing protein [Ginsengibacter sp.]
MADFPINKNGFWESTDSSGHLYDNRLSVGISVFFKKEKAETIVDLGCGTGNYVKALIKNGFECDGYDGNPNTELLTNGFGKVLDLSKPINLNKNYDWVLSLEVGEHIPVEFEDTFLDNMIHHAIKGIIISWGIPGQKGDGHVNCKSNSYIIGQMKKRGWKYDQISAKRLRNQATFGWFKNTIMVFRKTEGSKNIFQTMQLFFTKGST